MRKIIALLCLIGVGFCAHSQAAFELNTFGNPVCPPTEIECVDQSVGATSWFWVLIGPESQTSSNQNPYFTLITPGTYTVVLTINGDSTNTASETVHVAGDYGVSASVSPLDLCTDGQVTGTAVSTSGNIDFHWFFLTTSDDPVIGDPTQGYVSGGTGSSSDVVYTYEEWQSAHVILLADSAGCIQKALTEEVNISPPTARFSYNAFCLGARFNIYANLALSADEIVWKIIDGPDAGPDPIHTATSPAEADFYHLFNHSGEHVVELYVSSSFTGCSDTYSAIVVTNNPTPVVSIEPATALPGDTIHIQNSNPECDSIVYDFGNGTSSGYVAGTAEVTVVYDSPGIYQLQAISEVYYIDSGAVDICQSDGPVGTVVIGDDNTQIIGKVYNDINDNGLFDAGDEVFAGVPLILMPDNQTYYTNANGDYLAGTSFAGAHTLLPSPIYGLNCAGQYLFENTVPDNLPFQFTYSGDTSWMQDFAYIANPTPCRTLSGIVFEDTNENGVQDPGERGIANTAILSDGVLVTRTNGGGGFTLDIPESQSTTLTCAATASNSSYCNILINIYEQTYPEGNEGYPIAAQSGNSDDLDFGFAETQDTSFDVSLYTLIVNNGTEAGEEFDAWMDFKARGNIEQPCTLRITHSPLVTMLESSVPPALQTETEVAWVYNTGFVPSWYCMEMTWLLDSMAVAGEQLHWVATYTCPPDVDVCPYDNRIVRDITIQSGPLRPMNEIVQLRSMRPEGVMPEIVEPEVTLSYEVAFNNPLNAPLHHILVIDTLPDAIDLSTVSFPFSSEEGVTMRLEDDGILYLSAESADIGETGFFQFNARLKDGLIDGTAFENQATVLFNHTSPFTTNRVLHRFDEAVAVNETRSGQIRLSMYPNPMSRQMVLDIDGDPSASYQVQISDLMGRSLRQYHPITSRLLIERGTLPPGIYLLTIRATNDAQVSGSFRFVVQ